MKLNLSKLEILALQPVCDTDYSAGALAQKLGVKKSFFSRLLKELSDKGLVLAEKRGTEKIIRLSPASHAQSFRSLYQTRPNVKIEEWLSGRTMGILILMTGREGWTPFELLLEEGGCSKPTIYKLLKTLSGVGVIANAKGRGYKIGDSYVEDFAKKYADNLQRLMQKQAKGFNTSIRIRKHVVVRTDAKEVPPYFCETGLNALVKADLEANLTSYSDYYFNLDGKKCKISLEEAFVHSLLFSALPQYIADIILLKIFFAKNKGQMNKALLEKMAEKFNVKSQLYEVRRAAEDYQKMRDME